MYISKNYIVKSKNDFLEIESIKDAPRKRLIKNLAIIFVLFTMDSLRVFLIMGDLQLVPFPFWLILTFFIVMLYLNETWSIKIENRTMFIKHGIKKHEIPLEKIVNCYEYSSYNISSNNKITTYNTYICIEYLKNNRIKKVKLLINQEKEIRGVIICKKYERNLLDMDKAKELFDYFITKEELEITELEENKIETPNLKQSEFNKQGYYSFLRGQDENEIIEEILNRKEEKIKEEIDKSSKLVVALLLIFSLLIIAVFIGTIILGI